MTRIATKRNLTALLVSENESQRERLRALLCGLCSLVVESPPDAVAAALRESPAALVVVATTARRGAAALQAARAARDSSRFTPVLLLVEGGSEEFAIQALRAGVAEYLQEPCSPEDVLEAVQRLLGIPGRERAADPLIEGHRLIGNSAAVEGLRDSIRSAARNDANVLITGETGAGKELAAFLIHRNGHRGGAPFTCINCAAIPDGLLESELFGYERGAFTGATIRSEGKLKQAEGGTVLLDEISEIPPYCQAKLLRAIETKEFYRLGGVRPVPVDVRFICATNRDLERMTADGSFRQDLFFRLDVISIHVPALRERKEDVPALLDHYIAELNKLHSCSIEGVSADALDALLRHDWPGNIRELRNLVEAALLDNRAGRISFDRLPARFRDRMQQLQSAAGGDLERLLAALSRTHWNKSKAAEQLHWSRMTLYRKMAKYQISSKPPRRHSAATA